MISISDPNPVSVEIILFVSEHYPKVYYDAQHTFLCCVYFALLGKITAGVIFSLAAHDWQKWDRIRITGVDSDRILRFSFRPGSGPIVKNL